MTVRRFCFFAFLPFLLVILLSSCAENHIDSSEAEADSEADKSDECVYTAATFHSTEELVSYMKENVPGNEFGDPGLFEIDCPFDDYELNEIELSGDNIYFRFLPRDDKIPENGTPASASTNEMIPDLYIGWNYTHNGEHGLAYFTSQNRGYVFPAEDYDGVFYTDGYTINNELIGRMYYWVEEDCFFQATVPASKIEAFSTFLEKRNRYIQVVD